MRLRPFQEKVTFWRGLVQAEGTGDVKLELLKSIGERTRVVFHDVIYFPGLTANLTSNSALNLRGAYYHGWEHKIVLANVTEVANAPTVAGVPTATTGKPKPKNERPCCQRSRIRPVAIRMVQFALLCSDDGERMSGGGRRSQRIHAALMSWACSVISRSRDKNPREADAKNCTFSKG
jgi:hypothetical protein